MDVAEAIRTRRSVRDYDRSRQVSDEQLQELFELVQLSPSSYNLQPWEFIVVRNAEAKKKLKACAHGQQHVEDASATIIVLGTTNPSLQAEGIADDRMKKGTMDREKKKAFFTSVKHISANKDYSLLWTTKSTSLAAMTLMIAARSMGLDTCPMEGFDKECVRKEFGIPLQHEIIMLITLGYRQEKLPGRPMRFAPENMVHFDHYGNRP